MAYPIASVPLLSHFDVSIPYNIWEARRVISNNSTQTSRRNAGKVGGLSFLLAPYILSACGLDLLDPEKFYSSDISGDWRCEMLSQDSIKTLSNGSSEISEAEDPVEIFVRIGGRHILTSTKADFSQDSERLKIDTQDGLSMRAIYLETTKLNGRRGDVRLDVSRRVLFDLDTGTWSEIQVVDVVAISQMKPASNALGESFIIDKELKKMGDFSHTVTEIQAKCERLVEVESY